MNTIHRIFGRRTRVTYPETVEGSGIRIKTIQCGHMGLIGRLYYNAYHGLFRLAYKIYKPEFEFRYSRFGIDDIQVGGIDHSDHPKYCDAYIENAVWDDTLEELTENELDALNSRHSDRVYDEVQNSLY